MSTPLKKLKRYYIERYAPRFRHAKKLFIIDLGLVSVTIVLFIATVGYVVYKPTTDEKIILHIAVPNERIESGAQTMFGVSTHLLDKDYGQKHAPFSLTVEWPESFISTTDTHTTLLTFETSTAHSANVTGTYIGRPGELVPITVSITDRQGVTVAKARSWLVSRGSTISGSVVFEKDIPAIGETPIRIHVQNNGKETVGTLLLPLTLPAGFTLKNAQASEGEIVQSVLYLNQFAPGKTATITGTISTNVDRLSKEGRPFSLIFTPAITSASATFSQEPFQIHGHVKPIQMQFDTAWQNTPTAVSPGDTVTLTISPVSETHASLQNPTLFLVIDPQTVDTLLFARRYPKSTRVNDTIQLPLNESVFSTTTSIAIPLRSQTPATVLTLRGTIGPSYSFVQSPVATPFALPELPIGTTITFDGQVRYYTSEGDQLGRGPLPPKVGKETTYWVIVTIQNGNAPLERPTFTATLLPNTQIGNQVSATTGDTPTFDNHTRSVVWHGNTLPANTAVDIAFEIIFTPTPDMVGTSPTLLGNLKVEGIDRVTQKHLEKIIQSNLGTSVPLDDRAKKNGILVLP